MRHTCWHLLFIYSKKYQIFACNFSVGIQGKAPIDDLPSHSKVYLGPLHTRAKSRDREIVRAQKKVSKGRPNAPPKSWSVVPYPQV